MNHYLNDNTKYIGLTEHNYQQLDYTDGELAIINHLKYTPRMHATQINMIFIVMCFKGDFVFEMDETEYSIQQNDVFIGYPNALYNHFKMSPDLDCRMICISKQLLFEMLYPNQGIWNRALYLKRHYLIKMNEQERELCNHMNALICYNLQNGKRMFQKEIIHSLVQAMIFEFCQSLNNDTQFTNSRETNQKMILFDKFVSLLSLSDVKKHSLSYYADKLFVSPRYLTMVCREVSGKTAYDWIREYVQNDVRYHLLHTNMTIKEIAMKLGFCNLSFFGKYVRENFGKSPSDFRREAKS